MPLTFSLDRECCSTNYNDTVLFSVHDAESFLRTTRGDFCSERNHRCNIFIVLYVERLRNTIVTFYYLLRNLFTAILTARKPVELQTIKQENILPGFRIRLSR